MVGIVLSDGAGIALRHPDVGDANRLPTNGLPSVYWP